MPCIGSLAGLELEIPGRVTHRPTHFSSPAALLTAHRAPGPRLAGNSPSGACREPKTRLDPGAGGTKIGGVHFLPVIQSQLGQLLASWAVSQLNRDEEGWVRAV